jgi:hypothetical protein
MWAEDKKVPESRKKGYKAPHFTGVRKKIHDMKSDLEIWNWISRERGSQPTPQILKKNKMGRAPKNLMKNLPDTRNTNHEI